MSRITTIAQATNGISKDLDPTIMAQPFEAARHGGGFRIGDAVVVLGFMGWRDLLCLSWEARI